MHKLHHAPARRRAVSRRHIHHSGNPGADSPRIVFERIALCAGIAAFGILEIWLTIAIIQGLFPGF
jgi:hypothetical protein